MQRKQKGKERNGHKLVYLLHKFAGGRHEIILIFGSVTRVYPMIISSLIFDAGAVIAAVIAAVIDVGDFLDVTRKKYQAIMNRVFVVEGDYMADVGVDVVEDVEDTVQSKETPTTKATKLTSSMTVVFVWIEWL